MTKLRATFVFTALLSSSVVLANTNYYSQESDSNAVINQAEVLAESHQQLEELDVESRGGFTENDFFEY